MRKGPVSRMSRLRLKNFKSVGDSSPKLGGLTVVVGPNSSGKTTLIQSLLLRVLPSGRISWSKAGMISLNDEMTGLGTFKRIRRESAPDEEPLVLGGQLELRIDGLEEGWLRAVNTQGLGFLLRDDESEHLLLAWDLEIEDPEDPRDAYASKAMVSMSRIYCGSELLEPGLGEFSPEDSVAYIETRFSDLGNAPEKDGDPKAWQRMRTGSVEYRRQPTESNGKLKHPMAEFFWNPGVAVAYAEARDGLPERVWLKDSARAHAVDGILMTWDRHAYFAVRDQGESESELEVDEEAKVLEEGQARDLLVDQASKWVNAYLQWLEDRVGDKEDRVAGREPWDWFNQKGAGPLVDGGEFERLLDGATRTPDDSTNEANTQRAWTSYQAEGNFELLAKIYQLLHQDGGRQELRELILEHVDESSFVEVVWEEPRIGEFFSDVSKIISTYFNEQVFHLGALRAPPSVDYGQGNPSSDRSVGSRGEATVSRLYDLGNLSILCPTIGPEGRPRQRSLRAAVNYWMGEQGLGLFESHKVTTPGGGRYTFSVKLPGLEGKRYLNEVGDGVSQVLPVVVQCLLAEPGSLVLLQQPELHGHPGLQQKLANFLLACVRSGRQIILETHSEYLVSRLALRVAEDQSDETRDQVVLLLARQGESGTEYAKADLDRYGEIEWPEGFFDEGVSDALDTLKAGINKREGERGDSV